ncbi:protein DROOPING LEAF-like [Silene latifolia]|uniref:protein DROOPING LEAF-like n=1 Tax=Silene latifolia TaxID=37657 RepID=UPI003D7836F9
MNSMELGSPPDRICYVDCNFCNTVLAVVIPSMMLLETTVAVKCGHCGNVSCLNTRPPNCLDHQITLPQGNNLMEKPIEETTTTTTTTTTAYVASSSSSSASTHPLCPRPFLVKPREKKHRIPSAYNRFMKEEIQRIKAANPEIPHRQAFSAAAKNWSTQLSWVTCGEMQPPLRR